VGIDGKLLYTPDRVVGAKLDTRQSDRASTWRVGSPDDARFAAGVEPAAVFRKSKPSDLARIGSWQWDAPVRHVVYLRLPQPLAAGKRYVVKADGLGLAEQSFVYDPSALRSEAVHVSHLGFRPDDPSKVAFLSCWLGSGGPVEYRVGTPFQVVDAQTGRPALEGKVALSKAADDKTEDAYNRNYNGVDVYLMDFSSLERPGTYRVSVEGIGCSYPFEIADDVWRKAFVVSARGFYHQRSGIELGPPYTAFRRPRPFHPADGVEVFHSNAALMDTGNGLNHSDSNFGVLVANGTDKPVANAWGGYMDAGDWDRRIQHLDVSRLLLELADIAPDFFAKVSLNIPESSNDLPDVVDEALFNLDCYRRMQTPEGGIRGGIESAEHPRHGEGSWQESLRIYAYAPGVWSSYLYAGVAARAARWLEGRKPELAAVYRQSAVRAMLWAEAKLPERAGKKDPHDVRDARNLAAAELFRLTGVKRWHDLFLDTTVMKDPKADLFRWQHHEQREAAWVYARTDWPGMDPTVKQNCLAATLREADERVAWGERTGFRWTKYPWHPTSWGALSSPDGLSLVRAHLATGDPKYLRTLVLACQTGGGANPVNLCYTTGLGHDWPQHPLHIDSRITHQPPPPGLTVGGPIDVASHKDNWAQKIVARWCHPPVDRWPTIEAYWDVFWYPPMCEFTVHTPMAGNAYVWGYLAARR
jgi:endoglucanase